MRTDPEPDKARLDSGRHRAVFQTHAGGPSVGPDRLEMQARMLRILAQEPVILAGQPPNFGRQNTIMLPELRGGPVPHGRGAQRPALNSTLARSASRSSGPPGRASSSICASQSASHRRSKCAFNCHNSRRGSFSIAASISLTVLTGQHYRAAIIHSTPNTQPSTDT